MNSENDEEKTEDECPWPYLEELFIYRERKGDSVQMKCKLCLTSTMISVYKTSTSNLKKHIAVRGFTMQALFLIFTCVKVIISLPNSLSSWLVNERPTSSQQINKPSYQM